MKRPNLRTVGRDEKKKNKRKIKQRSKTKGNEEYLQNSLEEKLPYSKEGHAYSSARSIRTPKRLNQKIFSLRHVIIKTLNAPNKERILKTAGK